MLLCRTLFFYREINDRRLEVQWFLKRGSSEVVTHCQEETRALQCVHSQLMPRSRYQDAGR